MTDADAKTESKAFRIVDPSGTAILDTSALQGWPQPEIKRLSSRLRLAIPDCLLGEVLLKEHDEARRLLGRLNGVTCVVLSSLGAHCTWEVTHREPAGLLLCDEPYPGEPERTAQQKIDECSKCTADDHTLFVENFGVLIDRPNEVQWEEINNKVLKIHRNTPAGDAVRKAGLKEFLAGWSSVLQQPALTELICPYFQAFVDGFGPHADAEQMMSDAWTTFRTFLAYLTYPHLNVAVNPPHLKHERLNQRVDLHYLALTGPGMHLVTRDSEMRHLSRVISPRAHVICDPSEV